MLLVEVVNENYHSLHRYTTYNKHWSLDELHMYDLCIITGTAPIKYNYQEATKCGNLETLLRKGTTKSWEKKAYIDRWIIAENICSGGYSSGA